MKKNDLILRRDFLKSAAVAAMGSAALAVSGCNSTASVSMSKKSSVIERDFTILFQGDSITDGDRSQKREMIANDPRALGVGYAFNIASRILYDRPEDSLKFYNRGNSGWKVPQLASTWERNCISIKPDVLSILIGVNDIWHTMDDRFKYDGTVETYENGYRALLQRTFKELPNIKLVICEPFVLRCGVVNEKWFPQFDQYRTVARKLADEFNALFVPFQTMFDNATAKAPPEYWLFDGVHPTNPGAQLMAQEWLEVVGIG